MAESLYTTFQAAKLLGVTPDTVLKWIKSGKLPAIRTLGGHYRIRRERIDELIAERQLQNLAEEAPSSHRVFQYCWEFNSKRGELPDDCRRCLVYKTQARRCYEMSPVPKELGHMKLFCTSVCEDCDYYKQVKDRAPNILVISDDSRFLEAFDDNKTIFNVRATDNEQECFAFVEKMRPDFAVIDCSFSRSREFFDRLTNDPRIPFIKIILASDTEITSDYCNKKIIGRTSKSLTAEGIESLIASASR